MDDIDVDSVVLERSPRQSASRASLPEIANGRLQLVRCSMAQRDGNLCACISAGFMERRYLCGAVVVVVVGVIVCKAVTIDGKSLSDKNSFMDQHAVGADDVADRRVLF